MTDLLSDPFLQSRCTAVASFYYIVSPMAAIHIGVIPFTYIILQYAMAYRMQLHDTYYAACTEKSVYKAGSYQLLLSITFVKSTKSTFCSTFSYPAGSVHLKAKNKRMKASCVLLVLAVLLSSTLAKPMAYVDSDGQNGVNNDYLQYLLRLHGNGMSYLSVCECVCVCVQEPMQKFYRMDGCAWLAIWYAISYKIVY